MSSTIDDEPVVELGPACGAPVSADPVGEEDVRQPEYAQFTLSRLISGSA
jgi:hypothetical protein